MMAVVPASVASWELPLPPVSQEDMAGLEGGAEEVRAGSPIRVGSTGTIFSLMEREKAEMEKSRRVEPQKEGGGSGSGIGIGNGISRFFHNELGMTREAISVSCGLPLMTARQPGSRRCRTLKKTQRRQQLLQRDFGSCRLSKEGGTPAYIAARPRHRRKASEDSTDMLLESGGERESRHDVSPQEMSDCRIGRRKSKSSRMLDVVVEPKLTRSASRREGSSVRKTVRMHGSARVALAPFSPDLLVEGSPPAKGSRSKSRWYGDEAEASEKGVPVNAGEKDVAADGVEDVAVCSPEAIAAGRVSAVSNSSSSSSSFSGRPSTSSPFRAPELSRLLISIGLPDEASRGAGAASSLKNSPREDVRNSTFMSSSERTPEAEQKPSKASPPVNLEELRKSLIAERAARQQFKGLVFRDTPLYDPAKKELMSPRLRGESPGLSDLHRESTRLRESPTESLRRRELPGESVSRRAVSDLQRESVSPRIVRDLQRDSPRPKAAVSPKFGMAERLDTAAGSGKAAEPQPYHIVFEKINRQALQDSQTSAEAQQHTRMVQRGLIPTNPGMKPGSSSSRVLPFMKSDTEEDAEVDKKPCDREGVTTSPLTAAGRSSSKKSPRSEPSGVSLACSRPMWTKFKGHGTLAR